MAIPTPDCPCSVWGDNVCENLSECSAGMHYGDICQASTTLPDGNFNYDVQNCGFNWLNHNKYNVFECKKGKNNLIICILTHPYYHVFIFSHINDNYIKIIFAR